MYPFPRDDEACYNGDMRVTIRLFANFRIGRFKEETREYGSPPTVRGVVEELGIPGKEVGIIFINGRSAAMDQELAEGDSLSLFPLVGGG